MNRATTHRRLKTLAEHLKTVPPDSFNYETWFGGACNVDALLTQERGCGTTACAIGYVPAIPSFRRLKIGYHSYRDSAGGIHVRPTVNGVACSWEHLASFVFDLTGREFDFIFMPDCSLEGARFFSPGYKASAKEVAKHILRFIEWDRKRLSKKEVRA